MKKLYTLLLALVAATASIQAQTYLKLWQNDSSTRYTISEVGDINFSGSSLTIQGTTYNLSDIDSLIVVPEIHVTYNGETATVNVSKSIAKDVTVSINGGHVTITNNNVSNEVEVNLSGSSTDGSLTYNGELKATFRLNGLELTSSNGPALNILDGKRIDLVLTEGTTNVLADVAGGTHKGALYCKGHMEVSGAGALTVTGNTGHAISVKEYLQLKRSTGSITIGGAEKDAIHCGQYFLMNGGTVTIDANTKGDGIQVELDLLNDETVDPDADNTGELTINGGTVNMVIAGEDSEGLKSDRAVNIHGGTIYIDATGNGSRGIKADGNITIDEASATTTITVHAKGAKCNPTDGHKADRCMGIRGKADMTINAGTVTVTNTGAESRGIKLDGWYYKNGGTVNATDISAANIF